MKATICKFCPMKLPLKQKHRCLFVALFIASTTIDLHQHSHAVSAVAEQEGNTNSAASTNIEAITKDSSSFNWRSCLQERKSISVLWLLPGSKCCLFPMGCSQVLRVILKMIYAGLNTWQAISNKVTLLMSNDVTSSPVHGWTEHLSTACLVLSALPMSAEQQTINSILASSGSDICLYDLGFTLNICMCNLAP